jgi:hypothetical protein
MGERERLLRERNQMKERDQGSKGRQGSKGCQGRQGRAGRAGLGRAGLGWARLGRTVGQNPVARTTTERNPIREAKSETKLSNARD